MKNRYFVYLVCVFCFFSANADAFSLSKSRVIYPEEQKIQTVNILNKNGGPYLVQASVREWDSNAPSAVFVVSPPIFRMETDSPGAFRIMYSGKKLADDRESLFRLHVKIIPGGIKPEHDTSYVSYSVSLEHKLFFRPSGLSMNVNDAYERLTFRRDGGRIIISNPTPYYMTLSCLSQGGRVVDLNKEAVMLPPFSERSYLSVGEDKIVSWKLVNDAGVETRLYQSVIN